MTGELVIQEHAASGADQWDHLLTRYRNATVFHSAGWHQALDDSLPGRVVRLELTRDREVCGHWCGFFVPKFGFRLFGAPLPGTGTDYMYPLFIETPPPSEFLRAVAAWAASWRLSMVDLGGEYLTGEALQAAGYRVRPTRTYRVDLRGGEPGVWSGLKPAMRNKVRKAEKQGVVVEVDRSPDFARLYFDMLKAVFRRQKKVPTYDLGRVEALLRGLEPAGAVVPLVARRSDEPLATVILLQDRRVGYYWGGASYDAAYPVGANDLIQWRALQLCVSKGLETYDTCGGGEYKEKFGGTLVSLSAGHRPLHPVARLVRASVEQGMRARQALFGTVQRLAESLS